MQEVGTKAPGFNPPVVDTVPLIGMHMFPKTCIYARMIVMLKNPAVKGLTTGARCQMNMPSYPIGCYSVSIFFSKNC